MMKEAKQNPIYCIAMSREPSSTLLVKESCFRCYPECTPQRGVRSTVHRDENPGPRRRKVVAKNIQIQRRVAALSSAIT